MKFRPKLVGAVTALGAELGEEVAARSGLGPKAETGQQVLLSLH